MVKSGARKRAMEDNPAGLFDAAANENIRDEAVQVSVNGHDEAVQVSVNGHDEAVQVNVSARDGGLFRSRPTSLIRWLTCGERLTTKDPCLENFSSQQGF